MHNIVLREAQIEDLSLLQYWDTKQHVIDSDPDDDWNWEYELARNPDWREQFVAELDNRPIGFIQIIDPAKEESHYWGEVDENLKAIDIWIGEERDLGKGYGTEIMNLAIEICFNHKNIETILIDPLETNTRAIKFYKKIGFIFLETRIFNNSACTVLILTRRNWENNH